MEDLYQILGVPPNATQEEITRRYRFLALAYHPDRFSSLDAKAEAHREMSQINSAYQVLSDPLKRAEYDRRRADYHVEANVQTGAGAQAGSSRGYQEKQIDAAFQYFEKLIARWGGYIRLADNTRQLDAATEEFLGVVFGIAKGLVAHLGDQGVRLFLDEMKQGVQATQLINIALGMELAATDPPAGFTRKDLEEYSCVPIRAQINFVLEYGKAQKVYKQAQLSDINSRLANELSKICEASQLIGKELTVRLRQTQSSEPDQNGQKASNGPKKPLIQYCQSCGTMTETAHLTFIHIIGYLIVSRFKTIKGNLCAICSTKYFWETTGKTLLFGWLGPGVIAVPIILLLNWFNYIGSAGIRKRAGRYDNPASGWKAFIITMLVIGVIFLILPNLYLNSSKNSPNKTAASTSVSASDRIRPTQTLKPVSQPTRVVTTQFQAGPKPMLIPTNDLCLHWKSVRSQHEGKRVCVYGIVKKAYWGENPPIFFITFSDGTSDFRMIVLYGYYYDDIVGKCVEASGIVEFYGNMPYIELDDDISVYHQNDRCTQ